MSLELPDGISYNKVEEDLLEIEIPILSSIQWSCDKCEIGIEALLLNPYNRYEGVIRNSSTQIIFWENKLPRSEKKAQSMLQENFNKRVERHKGSH